MADSQFLGTIQMLGNLNEHHCYVTSVKSMISQIQIDANCSPFQSLNMLPFQARLERLNFDLLQFDMTFSKYQFKTGTLCLLFLSARVFTALEFYSSYSDILTLKNSKDTLP